MMNQQIIILKFGLEKKINNNLLWSHVNLRGLFMYH